MSRISRRALTDSRPVLTMTPTPRGGAGADICVRDEEQRCYSSQIGEIALHPPEGSASS